MKKWQIVLTTLLIGLIAAQAQAVDTYWQVGTGNWGTGSNWNNGEPTDIDYAYINNGGTAQITSSDEVCRDLYLGEGSGESGSVTQTGGTNTLSGWLSLGEQSGSNGTYNLSGTGQLSADGETIGYSGTGTFTQTGGTNTLSGWLYLGEQSGSNGTYNLSGTGQLSADWETIGDYGTGTFTQTGGTNTVSTSLYLGYAAGSNGTYNLSGTGQLSADGETIGYSGTGSFTQTGGTNTLSGWLFLGYNSGSNGTYTIFGGSLSTVDFYVGYDGSGTLNITGSAANITVSNLLHFGADSTFTAVPGSTIHMTGSAFENENTDATDLAGLSNLELIFEGGSADIDPFELAGEDMGAIMAGFTDNFALGTLTLGDVDIGKIQLVDDFDNQPGWLGSEALYVSNLNIGAGSYLDLNGLNLYYLQGSIDPAATIVYNGGNLFELLPGDFDLDGDVDGVDFGLWQSGYPTASGATLSDGDFDGDGDVDGVDFGLWQANYPTNLGGSAAIPEPTTMGLLIVGALAILRRRSR